MTATLPPADAGLGVAPVELVSRDEVGALPSDRYVIHLDPKEWDAAATAKQARKRFTQGGVAVILNTVRDACDVYRRVAEKENPSWRFLAAAMLPGHKAKVIADLRRMLKPRKAGKKCPPIGVVCTQVLEAGVDLSFRSLLRALPVFPSVVQAAGRANRHGAVGEPPAEVVVFDYRRDGGKQSRQFIYKSEIARDRTDAVLAANSAGRAGRAGGAGQVFPGPLGRGTGDGLPGPIRGFVRGTWSKLAGLTPFDGDDDWRVEVFVPHLDGDRYLPPRMARLLHRFAPAGPRQLLQRYGDSAFRRSLKDFRDRKRLAALVRQFTVAVPKKVAGRVATQNMEMDWLWVLNDPASYSAKTGLAHLLCEEEDDPSCQII